VPPEDLILRARVHRFEHLGRGGIAHREAVEIVHSDGVVRAPQRARQRGAQTYGAHRGRFACFGRKRAIQPAIGGRFQAGCSRFHVILRVEVGARGVGRSGGMDDGELLAIPQRLQRRERRVQAEEAIEIDAESPAGLGHRDGGAQVVIALFAVRHHDVQSIGGAALEDGDEYFFAAARRVVGKSRPLQPEWSGADADHGQRGVTKKNSA
jgi:hypothetical protein